MEKELFSPMAIDALGEMMNISLGSSATAVSNMLDHRVDITTPTVKVIKVSEFSLGKLEPAMGVEIKYVEGLEGSNIMLLKKSDVKVITDILMGTETPDEEFELNELTISCVCEVMNQMMGSAATALSDFLGYTVNISTPEAFEVDDMEEFKLSHFPLQAEMVVIVSFSLKIEGALESEFMNVMSVELARDLVSGLGLEEGEDASAPPPPPPAAAPSGGGEGKLSQEEIERLMQGGAASAPPPPAPSPEPSGAKLSQEEIERLINGGGADAAPPAPAPAPEPSGAKLSQEEIEKLIHGGGADAAPPAPAPSPEPSGAKLSQEEIEKLMSGGAASAPPPAPAPAPAQQPAAQMPVQPMPGQMPPQGMPGQAPDAGAFAGGYMGYPPMYYPPYPYPYPPQAEPPEPKVINTQPVKMSQLENTQVLNKEQAENLDLIMEVPLQVTVEIGRTKRKVQEILEFAKGSLVVLDKLAGDQVDLFVNGKCIAKGDVVVIDDNFGVRITELLQDQVIEGEHKK